MGPIFTKYCICVLDFMHFLCIPWGYYKINVFVQPKLTRHVIYFLMAHIFITKETDESNKATLTFQYRLLILVRSNSGFTFVISMNCLWIILDNEQLKSLASIYIDLHFNSTQILILDLELSPCIFYRIFHKLHIQQRYEMTHKSNYQGNQHTFINTSIFFDN